MDVISCQVVFMLLITAWKYINGAKQEICAAENFNGQCPKNTVILAESALYGSMKLGRCLELDLGYLGCENDVLYLVDRWCSGRQECTTAVPNQDLKAANTECDVRGIAPYLEVEYNCVTVAAAGHRNCASPSRVDIHGNEGYISSHVTAQSGCGTRRAPWIIEVPPGQTIDMWLLDFGALGRHLNTLGLGCQQTLGFVVERNLGSNFTICGDDQRKRHLYSSKTNRVELNILTNNPDDDIPGYLIQYTVIGCSDLTPPAHAWYKREGSEAVIGCKSNDRVWRLYCNGNTWDGVVGNCSKREGQQKGEDLATPLPFSSVIFLTCVVCGAILLVIVVVVAGAVYVKKQSIRHEIKLRSDYVSATLPSAQYFPAKTPGYDVTLGRTMARVPNMGDSQPLVQISDKNFSDLTLMKNCSSVPRGTN